MGRAAAEQGNNTRFLFTLGHLIALTRCLARLTLMPPVGRLFEPSAQTTTLKPAVRVAGQHGANAIIVIAQNVETTGYSTTSFAQGQSTTNFNASAYGNSVYGHANTNTNAWGSSLTLPNRRGKARVLAIKFT